WPRVGRRAGFHRPAFAPAAFAPCRIRGRAAFDFLCDRFFSAHLFTHYRRGTGPEMVGDSEAGSDCPLGGAAAPMVLLGVLSVWVAAKSHRPMAVASGRHR